MEVAQYVFRSKTNAYRVMINYSSNNKYMQIGIMSCYVSLYHLRRGKDTRAYLEDLLISLRGDFINLSGDGAIEPTFRDRRPKRNVEASKC